MNGLAPPDQVSPARTTGRRWAAVTMAYNEGPRLGLWLRHYGAAVGLDNIFVVDDGSTDGATERARTQGANLLRIPRRPFSDLRRVRFITQLAQALLHTHDGVLYTDTDEFLLPDPARYASLGDYLQSLDADRATAVGLNVYQMPGDGLPADSPEGQVSAPLDWHAPVLAQRPHVRFASSMCKTLLWRRPMAWSEGFHASRPGPLLDQDLYLFHLKYADTTAVFERLALTRAMAWDEDNLKRELGAHQRISDATLRQRLDQVVALRRAGLAPFDFSECLALATPTEAQPADALVGLKGNVLGPLCRLPDRFLRAL